MNQEQTNIISLTHTTPDEPPLTKDVEYKFHEGKDEEAKTDREVGGIYMYVFDMFMEVHGTYPQELVNTEDYERLGKMMNLALQGYRFDI